MSVTMFVIVLYIDVANDPLALPPCRHTTFTNRRRALKVIANIEPRHCSQELRGDVHQKVQHSEGNDVEQAVWDGCILLDFQGEQNHKKQERCCAASLFDLLL